MRFGIAYAFVFLFLVGSFVSAAVAPGPSCKIEGVIQNSTYFPAWKHSCLSNNTNAEGFSEVCPVGGRLAYPERYELQVSVDKAENSGDGGERCSDYYRNSVTIFIPVQNVSNPNNLKVGGNIKFDVLVHDFEVNTYYVNASPGCKSLYWIDNENKSCGQQEFCGAYMYYGLQTFSTKERCLKAIVNKNESCMEYDGICCRGDICPMVEIICSPGLTYSFVTCDDNCSPVIECINKTKTFNLSNGQKAEIKIMPETASEKAIERLGELNFTIELKEIGGGTMAVYEVRGEKQGKLFGLFKVKANVSVQVSVESGAIVTTKKPWWAFLASGI